MKPKQLVIPLVCTALGYSIGGIFPFLGGGPSDAESGAALAGSAINQSSNPRDSAHLDGSAARTKSAERSSASKHSEPRVSIPVSSVVAILNSRPAYQAGFENYEHSMGEALILLGASSQEKSQVMELMAQTKNDLLLTERSVLEAKVINDFEAGIDLSQMNQAAAAIIERTQIGLKSILPSDIGDAIVTSINWNNFYRSDLAGDPGKVSFKITRDPDGKLNYRINFTNGSAIMGASEGLYDDGLAIHADEVFPERWRPLLAGVELLPSKSH